MITPQIDGHSCGVLADNALHHYIDPTNGSLIGSSSGDVIEQRLKLFIATAQAVIARVSLIFLRVSTSVFTAVFKKVGTAQNRTHFTARP